MIPTSNSPVQDDLPISKTKRKQQMHELQALGGVLVRLPEEQLERVTMPESLRLAVADARKMKSTSEARRRQMQYIGRLMRSVDVEPIREHVTGLMATSRVEAAKFHNLEAWRTRLLEDDNALSEFVATYAAADAQHLRSLIRATRTEQAAGKPLRQFRALFRAVRELVEQVPSAGDDP